MAEQTQEPILPAEKPFVTCTEAKQKIDELIALAPTGGKLLGLISFSHISTLVLSQGGDNEWRIAVRITVPRFANGLFGMLANWGVPGSERSIQFVVAGKANACRTENVDGTNKRQAHSYRVLNGSVHDITDLEIEQSVPFRDRTVRMWYKTKFDSTDFDRILEVVRSEVTGQPVDWGAATKR